MLLNNFEMNSQNASITIKASQKEWKIVNDNVMGGVSIGDFKIEKTK